MNQTIDFVVIGSGIAGLNAALTLSSFGKVIVVTKKTITDSATGFAQGGIAAVTNKKDTIASHEKDTMIAGAFHNNKKAVQFLVNHGKSAIEALLNSGVHFEKTTTLEAAHSFPRILHATDFTGFAIEKALSESVIKNSHIEVWENSYAIDLIVLSNKCFGVRVIKNKSVTSLFARAVVVATGGIGQLYQRTTNPTVATGDGIAMAHRAGAKCADLEFIQFHPTALLSSKGRSASGRKGKSSQLFLLSEALRGEEAHLVDKNGKQFINELLPRDVVARAIFHKQKESNVYLDIRHKGKTFLAKRFPNIYKELKKKGFDLATDKIPVTPAEHFLCGGIQTDIYGKTSIKNLFAYGETAATCVHGANRLASNSLLEGMVFSSQIAKCISELPETPTAIKSSTLTYGKTKQNKNYKKQIQKIMWEYLGIERSRKGMAVALKELKTINKKLKTTKNVNEEFVEVKNMAQTALLITQAALKRKKSLGTHYVIDRK